MATDSDEELERKLWDLESRLPAHSVPARMIAELEELEEELERRKAGRSASALPQRSPDSTPEKAKES